MVTSTRPAPSPWSNHYQKTAELITRHWERRAHQFVTLMAVLAGAVLVAFARQAVLGSLLVLFFAARLFFDFPRDLPPSSSPATPCCNGEQGLPVRGRYHSSSFGPLALARYSWLSSMPEADVQSAPDRDTA